MNKHFYRIVFNKARGLLMVVAEIVKRHQGEGRSSQKAKAKTLASQQDSLTAKKSLKLALNPITVMSYLVFGWISLVQPSYATTIVVDQSANKTQRPTVTEAANGVTQVNIQAPTSGGVSHNKYTQFDVSDKGVILNNSNQASKTELAGYVKGNAFLAGSNGAKIILNEVNSKNASQLAGYIEVAGQKAQVIIANAAGITCNGCGFINADRGTLTTGKPIMENGKLMGYQVEQGQIDINGKGLDSSRQNYTDLIARTVSINADIWGDDIKVVAGRNNVSTDVKQITKLADNGSTRPQVAIDVSALGGMYAGKIQMVGTESGVGVNNSGNLGASAGSITISADGKIVNSGSIQAQKEIKLTSQQTIDNQKQIYAKGNIQLNSADNINNSGTIVAQNNIALNAKNTIQSQAESTIAAGVDERGKLTGQGGLSVQAKTITLQGQNLATQSIVLNAETRVNLDNSVLVGDDMTIEANDVSAKSAAINSSGSLDINASQTVNTSKSKITSQGEINIVANDIQNNESSWQSGQGMSLNASTINNRDTNLVSLGELTQTAKLTLDNENSQLQAKGNINQVAQTINNKNSELLSEKNINLQADNANNEFSTIRAQGSITQNVINQLNNQATTFVSGGDMNLHADRLIQSQSSLTANGNIQITSNNIDNDEATLLSENIIIQAKTLSGGGNLSATNDITLGLENEFINKGEIKANNALTITSDKTISNHNQLVAGNILTLSSDALINEENAEISADNLVLKHETLDNQGLIDGEAVNISTTLLNNNRTGRIYGSDLTIQTQTLNNNGDGIAAPVIAARNNFNLAVDTLNNYTHGLLLSLGDFNIGKILDENGKIAGSTQIINNHSSTIEAQGDLTITADTLNNINDNIITEEVLVDSKNVNEWSFIEAPDVRYSNNEVTEYCVGCGGKTNYRELKILSTGKIGTKYNHYIYTETTYETQVVETDPGKIISGGNLTLITNKTFNDNSHINAGNQLTLIGELENKVIDSISKIIRSGTRYYYYDYYPGKGKHYTDAPTAYTYNPLDEISSIDLGLSTIQDNIIINPNDTDLSGRSELGDNDLNTQEISVGSVSTVNPNTSLPDSSLYTVNKEADKNYLIETDSRFTNKKNWLSSDYMFEQLKTDPNNIQKRLGDGYYEQQLIKEQITALTGQRYLGDYSSDLEQYQALMNSGVEFANNYGLTVGVALTPEQMQALTSDIVWMVSKTVNIDGQDIEVLVPQVYVVNRPQITGAGALISGKNATIESQGDIQSSGVIVAKDKLVVSANNIENLGTLQGGHVDISAVDSVLSSGKILADSSLQINAGNDINLISTTNTQERKTGQGHDIQTVIDKTSTVSVKNGDMVIKAGNDINTAGALLVNQSKEGSITLDAGNDLNLSNVTTRDKIEYIASDKNYVKSDASHVVGSEIYGQGNINLKAGNDINVNASTVSAGNALNLDANNVNVNSVSSSRDVDAHLEVTTKGTFSKTKSTYNLDMENTLQNGSSLSGNSVNINAKQDITVTGSSVVGTKDVNLTAGNDVTINAAEESYYQKENTTTKTSGLMSSGGLGFTIGKEKESTTTTDTEQGYVGSIVGSTEGSVNITAGKNVGIQGSDVIAKEDINLQGENVNIVADDSKVTYREEYKYEKTGLTVAVTGTVADIYDAAKAVDNARKNDNDTLLALQSIKAGLTGANAGLDIYGAATGSSSSEASIGINASFGTEKTERELNQEQHNVVGSGVSAGNNINITATGNDQKEGGDINIVGSEVRAGNDINLDANRDVNVIGAVNTQHSDSDETSTSSSFGVGLTVGSNGDFGWKFSGNTSFSRERENADGSAWSEGIVSAGNNLNVSSGNNVNVVGGQLEGDTVKMDVGNDLNIQSLQDTDNYDYDKLSTSISGSYTYGSNNVSASFSTSKTDMESNWASVTDQSGIYAGSGGFDITVGNNTDLKGGVIASDAEDKSKNKLDTGTISFEDIENKADFNVDHVSINVGVGGNNDIGYTPSPSGPSIYHNEGKDSSTTKSAVEEGTLIVRDTDKQTQNINDLSRDTENANDPLGQIFDKQKEQDRMDALDLVKDITAQAHDVANKYDLINAEEKYKGLSESEKDELKKKAEQALNDKGTPATPDAINSYIINQIVQNEGIGNMGGSFSKGLDAASSIISGIITGDITGGLAGASAPYLAGLIKEQTYMRDDKGNIIYGPDGNPKVNEEANRIAHAILGAAVAAAQGNSALAGGAGALTGEVMADIIRETLYGKEVKDLTEAEKQNISNLSQIASGLAVAAGGGSVSDVGTAASASKNAVENNSQGLWNGGDIIGLSPETGANYDNILNASAAGYLTPEETNKLLDEMNSGKFMYDPLREDLKNLPEDIAILTTPYGDYIAFRDAETWGDYAIAAVGVLPFAKYIKIGGKVIKIETKAAQSLVKEAENAYKAGNFAEGNRLMNQAASQSTQVETTIVKNSTLTNKTPSNPSSQAGSGVTKPADSLNTNNSSQLVPGGGLSAHEAAGGHLIERHVGKTEEELLQRVSTGNVKSASSFTDRATAESITSKAIDANQTKIQEYLASSQKGYLEIEYRSSSSIGISVTQGQSGSVKVNNARIIIARDPSMPTGYRIITGYPTQ